MFRHLCTPNGVFYSMSLYAKYINERENKEIIETEQGFATYFYIDSGVYIQDIYVSSDQRQSGVAASFADQIAKLAKSKGYSKMYGSVRIGTKGATDSLKVLLAYGFELDSAGTNGIVMVKDI